MKDLLNTMLNACEHYLMEKAWEEDENPYIRECLLDAHSPIIRIEYRNGITLFVNIEDYGYNDIIRMTHDYGNEAYVYIDKKNIFDFS